MTSAPTDPPRTEPLRSEPDSPEPRRCPSCGRDAVVRIVYGMPGPDLADAAEAGTVTLGGCLISEDNPAWHCRGCDDRWR